MVSVENVHSGYPLIILTFARVMKLKSVRINLVKGQCANYSLECVFRKSDQVNEISFQLDLSKSMLNVTFNFILMQEICEQCDVTKNCDLSMGRYF